MTEAPKPPRSNAEETAITIITATIVGGIAVFIVGLVVIGLMWLVKTVL